MSDLRERRRVPSLPSLREAIKEQQEHAAAAEQRRAEREAEEEAAGGSSDEDEHLEVELDEEEVLRSPRREPRKGSVVFVLPAANKDATEEEKALPLLERPAHDIRDSLLHSRSGFDDFRGLYNLAVFALAVTGFRIALENFLHYGILIDPFQWAGALNQDWGSVPNLLLLMLINIFIIAGLGIEKAAASKLVSPKAADVLHGANLVVALAFPIGYVLYTHGHPIPSFLALAEAVIVWMKLVSYAAVNAHYRRNPGGSGDDKSKELVRYPGNLTLCNIYYFMFAPTLCYELNFPRTKKIRKRFLLRRVAEAIFLLCLGAGLAQQWMSPTLNNTFNKGEETTTVARTVVHFMERALKLALPNNLLWLLFFYLYFHDYLNIMGELMRFGDRQFYRDWWNATTISYFWRNWNIPVHKWARRHVYAPLIDAGVSRIMAQVAVFLLSAVFHEILVSVPLRMFKFWSFLGIFVQVPLALVNDRYLKGTAYGNVVVWASLFVGQPIALMLYMHAYLESQQAASK